MATRSLRRPLLRKALLVLGSVGQDSCEPAAQRRLRLSMGHADEETLLLLPSRRSPGLLLPDWSSDDLLSIFTGCCERVGLGVDRVVTLC